MYILKIGRKEQGKNYSPREEICISNFPELIKKIQERWDNLGFNPCRPAITGKWEFTDPCPLSVQFLGVKCPSVSKIFEGRIGCALITDLTSPLTAKIFGAQLEIELDTPKKRVTVLFAPGQTDDSANLKHVIKLLSVLDKHVQADNNFTVWPRKYITTAKNSYIRWLATNGQIPDELRGVCANVAQALHNKEERKLRNARETWERLLQGQRSLQEI